MFFCSSRAAVRRSLSAAVILAAGLLTAGPAAALSPLPPTVTALTPNHGPAAGGNEVKVEGYSLGFASRIQFGDTKVSIGGAGTTFIAPPGRAGTTVDVVALSYDGVSLGYGAPVPYTYDGRTRYAVTPSPARGTPTGGNTISLAGADINWSAVTDVWFGKTKGQIERTTPSAASVVVPAGTPGETVELTVRTADGEIEGRIKDRYTYEWTANAPVITSVSPTAVWPRFSLDFWWSEDDRIFVYGTDLKGATGVTIGGEPTEFSVYESDASGATAPYISFSAPYRGPGPVDIRVTTWAGTSTNTPVDDITIRPRPPAPTITSVTPKRGSTAGGTYLTIRGENLTKIRWVYFGTSVARQSVQTSDEEIRVTAPAGNVGKTDIVIEALGGKSDPSGTADDFTYSNDPTVITPTHGPRAGGNEVTLSGDTIAWDLVSEIRLASDQTVLAIASRDASSVTVTMPSGLAGASSTLDILDTNRYFMGRTRDPYRWDEGGPFGAPTVSSITPASGPVDGGNDITIRGRGFTAVDYVEFGGVMFHSNSIASISDTELLVTVPRGAAPGPVDVTVGSSIGPSTTVPSGYTYVGEPGPAPLILSITPRRVPAGATTRIEVTGLNLRSIRGVWIGNKKAYYRASGGKVWIYVPPGEVGYDAWVRIKTTKGDTLDRQNNPRIIWE